MSDLDTLRPEVQKAINRTDMTIEMFDTLVTVSREDYDLIRAELLRLTVDCAWLVDCINTWPPAQRRLIDRAERAESELAALKARIADAPVYEIPLSKPKSEDGWVRVIESVKNERSVRGKRVRLVVEE